MADVTKTQVIKVIYDATEAEQKANARLRVMSSGESRTTRKPRNERPGRP